MCGANHFSFMSSGGDSMRICGFAAFGEMRDRVFRDHEGAARVDLVHQVEALHLGRLASVVRLIALALLTRMSMPPNVAAVLSIAAFTRLLVAHVDWQRQRLAAGRLDLRGRGVDRARQLRMRLGGLGRDRDVGAVARRAQRDGEPDAARGAGDEEGLAGARLVIAALA